MNLALYIARRLYKDVPSGEGEASLNPHSSRNAVTKPAVRIAMLGIAIGVAVMIVSIAVVLGFKHTVRDKVVGFGSHIVVSNYMTLQTADQSQPIYASDSLMKVLNDIKGVRHAERYSLKQGVLKTDDDFLGVMFKGIGEDYDMTFLAESMVEGEVPHYPTGKENVAGRQESKGARWLLVSKSIAQRLKLKVGGKVYAYFLDESGVRTRVFEVSGIYQTNLTKYDDAFCFADLNTVSRLAYASDRVTGCELLVEDFDSIDIVEDRIIDKVNKTQDGEGRPLSSLTVKEMNPQIFSWLDLLDLNVWIILILMVCVAGFTMVSGLLIIILERTNVIGLLKTLGARNSLVRRTFRWLALFIAVKGLVIGNVIGIGVCLLQRYTGLVKLDAETYYVSEVPVELDWQLILLLDVATLLICTAALVLPSFSASMVKPARTINAS